MGTKLLFSGMFLPMVICFAAIFDGKSADPGTGTELVFAMMVHRHGDRTPMSKADIVALNLFNDEINALVEKWGYGQITDIGLRTAFKTGEFIRRRYNDLISTKYNDTEIYIRSTDVTRTKLSVLSAMAAVYRPDGETWSKDINWVPVPYTTRPVKEDYTQPWFSCPKIRKLFKKNIQSPATFLHIMNKNTNLAPKLVHLLEDKHVGNGSNPIRLIQAYDVWTALISMGYNVGDDIIKLYPELSSAADNTWDYLLTYDDNMRQLLAGVLLDEFFVNANDIIAGRRTHKVRIYSAHDMTVFGLESVTGVNRQGRPRYGSLFSLELRRNDETGRYFVLPVYLSDPHKGAEMFLQVEGCGGGFLCNYDQFSRITAKYRLDQNTWKTKCAVDDDEGENNDNM